MDPFTLALIVGASLWLTDTSLSGLLRAELGGGTSGAARGAGRAFKDRHRKASRRRRNKRSKSRFGRFVNRVLDGFGALLRGAGSGYVEGRRRGHEKRRERWAKKPPWWERVFGASEPDPEPEDEPEQTPNGDPERRCSWTVSPRVFAAFGVQKECGKPATDGPFCARHAEEARRTPCVKCGQPLVPNHVCTPNGDPEDLEEVARPDPEDDPEREPEHRGCIEQIGVRPKGSVPIFCGEPVAEGGLYCPEHQGSEQPEQQESEQPEIDGTNVPTERGTITVSDLTSAPAVIAAWEELLARFEQLQAEADELATTAGQLRDGAGDFATGTEGDAADSVQAIHDAVIYAKERVQVTVDALHEEWDQHIGAAEGRTAPAHSPFQEV